MKRVNLIPWVLMFIAIVLVSLISCHTEKEWIVKSYAESNGMYLVKAESGKKTKEFIIECKPDSVNQKFKW